MKLWRVLLAGCVGVTLGCDPEPKDAPKPGAKPEVKDEPTPIKVRRSDTLAPDELGIEKFVFEEKVPAGKVMVLRRTEGRNGLKKKGLNETIQYTDGGPARQVVLVYDLSTFPFSTAEAKEIRVKYPGSSTSHFPGFRWSESTTTPGRLVLEFSDARNDTVQMTFECFIEDYKTAKARIPKLSAASPGVTWTHHKQFDDE